MFSASLRRPRQGELPWIQRQLSRLEISLTPELHLGSLTNPLNSGKSPQKSHPGKPGRAIFTEFWLVVPWRSEGRWNRGKFWEYQERSGQKDGSDG